jgi:hypothetical protein
MRTFPTLLLCWMVTGLATVGGSMLGNAGGSIGLKVGAVLGGIIGLLIALGIARRLSWIPASETRGGLVGGLIGFAAAIAITLSNMDTPVAAVMSTGLVGVGVLMGAGFARGWARAGRGA